MHIICNFIMSKKFKEDRKNLKLAQLRDIGREITAI